MKSPSQGRNSKQQPSRLVGEKKGPRCCKKDTAGQASEQKTLPYGFHFSPGY